MRNNIGKLIEAACGKRLNQMTFLPGGSVGEVWKLTFEDQSFAVAKTANHGNHLDIEGFMLCYLKQYSNLPVPEVILAHPDLLVISWVENDNCRSSTTDKNAAEILLALHQNTQKSFGFEKDTLIGSLHQPNPLTDSWIDFFRDQRLIHMAQTAYIRGHLTVEILNRVEKLACNLDQFITEPDFPSLLHGDIWAGNVLYHQNRLAAFIDPAIYYGHREIELAYSTLFHTFGPDFFARYHEDYPLDQDFYNVRLPLYHLYPLLVHCALFGGSYLLETDQILRHFTDLRPS